MSKGDSVHARQRQTCSCSKTNDDSETKDTFWEWQCSYVNGRLFVSQTRRCWRSSATSPSVATPLTVNFCCHTGHYEDCFSMNKRGSIEGVSTGEWERVGQGWGLASGCTHCYLSGVLLSLCWCGRHNGEVWDYFLRVLCLAGARFAAKVVCRKVNLLHTLLHQVTHDAVTRPCVAGDPRSQALSLGHFKMATAKPGHVSADRRRSILRLLRRNRAGFVATEQSVLQSNYTNQSILPPDFFRYGRIICKHVQTTDIVCDLKSMITGCFA